MNRVKISKFLSYILRHNPGKFGIRVDRLGYADLGEVVRRVKNKFKGAGESEVREVVKNSPKERFEINGGKIRATYGHSIDVNLDLASVKPPDILYHGTPQKNREKILEEGLKSMGRNYVHLSATEKEAEKVGKRRDSQPLILKIDALKTWEDGIKFYSSGKLYLTPAVSPVYITENIN
ncbi:MAG: RNA 2'-phosphotransferase [Elusimicrobiota bacterium]